MTKSGWARRLQQAARVGVVGLSVVVMGAQGTARAEDGEAPSIWNLNERVMKGFMSSLGLSDGSGGPGIDYRERSPLVVPPGRNLPPPEAAVAPSNPAWPVDPDVKQRREASKKSKKFLTGTEEDSRALLPSELDPPAVREAARRNGSNGSGAATGGNEGNMSPSELGYFGGIFSKKAFGFGVQSDEIGTFRQEPPRESLAAPPAGSQTPSATEPYGVTKRIERKVTPYDPAVGNSGRPN